MVQAPSPRTRQRHTGAGMSTASRHAILGRALLAVAVPGSPGQTIAARRADGGTPSTAYGTPSQHMAVSRRRRAHPLSVHKQRMSRAGGRALARKASSRAMSPARSTASPGITYTSRRRPSSAPSNCGAQPRNSAWLRPSTPPNWWPATRARSESGSARWMAAPSLSLRLSACAAAHVLGTSVSPAGSAGPTGHARVTLAMGARSQCRARGPLLFRVRLEGAGFARAWKRK